MPESDWPRVSSAPPCTYSFAVSKRLTPRSRARRIHSRAPSWPTESPYVSHEPRAIVEPSRPDRPSLRYRTLATILRGQGQIRRPRELETHVPMAATSLSAADGESAVRFLAAVRCSTS